MNASARIHWVRVLIGGFLAELSVFAVVVPVSLFYGQHALLYAAPPASLVTCFLFALWVGRRVDSRFVLHGILVGVVATLLYVGLTLGRPEPLAYLVAHVLKILGGAAGGLVAARRGSLLGAREEEQRIVVAPYKQALATACGLLVGGFLFHRFGLDNSVDFSDWKLYQVAALLGGIGLAGLFTEAWLGAVIGLGIAPTLIVSVEVNQRPAESMWPIILPFIFLLGLPAPLIGGGISRLLMRTRFPRMVYIVALTGALVIGGLWPSIQNAKRQKLETETVPILLKQIYDAEVVYRANQPDGNFACDGSFLPGAAGKLGWDHGERAIIKKYLRVQYYNISLDCPNEINPRSFRVRANSNNGYIHAPLLSIDETGKLVVEPAPPKGPNTH